MGSRYLRITRQRRRNIVKEKAIQTDQLKLTYNLMDYNEEWREAIWQLLSGEFDAEEYTAKFNPQPVVFEIKL